MVHSGVSYFPLLTAICNSRPEMEQALAELAPLYTELKASASRRRHNSTPSAQIC